MDSNRFDSLTKAMARGVSRRQFLKALTGAAVGIGTATLHEPAGAVICRAGGVLCARDAQCCSGSCVDHRCTCTDPSQVLCHGRCAACCADNDCSTNNECRGGQCVQVCAPATNCPAGQTCGTAPDGCGNDIPCGQCDDSQCQTCLDGHCASTCGDDQACCGGTCTDLTTISNCGSCGTVCTTNLANATPICRDGSCGYACTSGLPLCPDGSCAPAGGCCTDTACTGLSDSCHTGVCQDHTCVAQVNQGASCDDGDACTIGAMCQSDGSCGGGTAVSCDDGLTCTTDSCDPGTGCIHTLQPGYCLIASACVGSGDANPANPCQICDPTSATDAWSNATEGTACGDGSICCGDTCVTGTCCNATGIACTQSNDCCSGHCVDGVCCASENVCGTSPNQTCCGSGMTCCSGTCQATACCPAGKTYCPGGFEDDCVDLQTSQYSCGACYTPCLQAGGWQFGTCSSGHCCPSGETYCPGTGFSPAGCANLQSDANNCGACGSLCLKVRGGSYILGTCSHGQCCEAGQTSCDGTCVDTNIDPNNCGRCGHACYGGDVPSGHGRYGCAGGSCTPVCDSGYTNCFGDCVDLKFDSDHCGTCDTECPCQGRPGGQCFNGTCCLDHGSSVGTCGLPCCYGTPGPLSFFCP